MEGKTIKEWLESIEDTTIREQALKYQVNFSTIPKKSLPQALQYAFEWHKTPEGHMYWERINSKILLNGSI